MYLDVEKTDDFFKPRWSAFVLDTAPKSMYETWHMVVQSVSTLAITKQSDQLPALSGIVQNMQRKGAGMYLAGLWQNNLPTNLLWCASGTRPKEWRALSWSWTSITGDQVKFPAKDSYYSRKYTVDINSSSCTPAGADPTGEVSDGSIVLAGLVTECQAGRGSVMGIAIKWRQRILFKNDLCCRMICDSREAKDAEDIPLGCKVYTLLMRRSDEDYNYTFNEPTEFYALVLRESRGFGGRKGVPGAFERIGITEFGRYWDGSGLARVSWKKWFQDAETKSLTIV